MRITFIFSIFCCITCSCISKSDPIPEKQKILFFKDKDGLYEYDLIRQKEKLICKIADSLYFLDQRYQLIKDTLTFGTCTEVNYSTQKESHTEYYYTVLLNSGKMWLSSKTSYEITNDRYLTIQTVQITPSGKSTVVLNKTEPFKSSRGNNIHIHYNETAPPRFYSSDSLDNQMVYSFQGTIYFVKNQDASVLVENKDGFEPKFGRGNFDPIIHPNKKYVLFNYLPGAFTFKDSELRMINLETKKIHLVKSGNFGNTSFSGDGKFILFTRLKNDPAKDDESMEIFVLNMSNWKETKIGESNYAYWLRQ